MWGLCGSGKQSTRRISPMSWRTAPRLCAGWTSRACFCCQAEDGMRDYKVTGVQTCALPILDDYLVKPVQPRQILSVITRLLADAVALEQTRDHREDLARLDRLHEVVVHLDPDRLAQRALVLALRDHHDGHGGVERADLADQLESASPRHLLVQQHDAVGLAPQQRERVVAMGRGGHREPLVLEEAPVRGESFDFVIHPEDGFRPHHRPKLMTTGEAGQRRTYFATCCAFSWSVSAPSATSC